MPRLLAINAVAHPGGAEIGLLRLIERLPGWDVTFTTPAEGPLADAARRLGATTRALPLGALAPGAKARALASMPRARRLAADHDITYLNGTVAGRLLPALGAARTVLHVHDLVTRVPSHWHRATTILADSEAVADRLAPLEAHVVHCPVELDHPQHPNPPWRPDHRPVVGYVGRIEPRKGVLDLVRAAPAVGARVVVVGDDPYASDAEYGRLVAASTDVEHHGWVDDAAGLMGHLDVLVLPSYAEPFGTVLAEAMAAGTPVVATTVGGLPEVVTDGVDGVLVPPGRPDALAAGINRVLAHRDEMGRRAIESARRFDADAYARRVQALIAA
ncbi:MAG: glycosyltransferase family 1 protein [Solirubrobacterales bacterium]|nr:glycosyltransferase family 1 protein [Solirubrobacterales bacterium]